MSIAVRRRKDARFGLKKGLLRALSLMGEGAYAPL
jgi:hypothetical protein